MNRHILRSLLALCAMTISSPSALADWSVSTSQSHVNFVSVKNASVTEVHKLGAVQGILAEDGKVDIAVQLDSVSTGIEIRDTRMKEFLFETSQFPNAVISAHIDMAKLASLQAGQSQTLSVDFDLTLHGHTQTLPTTVQVTATQDEGFIVSSASPIVIKADHFDLAKGVEKLRELAGLNHIAVGIPVTFSLVLQPK